MPVFKAYFKVMRGAVVTLMINLLIFTGLALFFSSVAPGTAITDFEPSRTPLIVIDRDGSPLTRGLVDYLALTNELLSFPDDREKLQDALFYREAEYVAIIPSGFTEAFMDGRDCSLQKVTVPDSTSSYYVDLLIDKFLNTVRLHRLCDEEMTPLDLVAAAMADLSFDTPVILKTGSRPRGYDQPFSYYFAYCAFALLAMIVAGISSIMIAFNKPDLYLRSLSSPLPRRRMNLQLAAGHGVFAVACWALLLAGSFILHGESLLASGLTGLYALNTLVFAAVSASIGFMAGVFVKSKGAQAGLNNAIALGLSFLGGVFVPQAFMSKVVLAAARFLPTYWFIRANDLIGKLSGFAGENLYPIYESILVQLGFAAAIFAVTLFVGKETRGPGAIPDAIRPEKEIK